MDLFPDFDSTLREAFRREIELFFASIIQEDRSILDLLTADYTFVNERLAKHYGIPDVYGPQFRRVTLGPELDMRRGLLGKGALLTITSDAARTSPVKRGKWFLQTFLGVSPPDPPPGVETELKKAGEAPKTMRERLEVHRTNPSCATCHQMFEPMGLAMENFDAVGQWRTTEVGNRSIRSASRTTAPARRPQGPARPHREQRRDVRGIRDREAADLCHRPWPRVRRHAAGPFADARRGEGRLSVFVADHGCDPESGLHDEHESCRGYEPAAVATRGSKAMFITKKHISAAPCCAAPAPRSPCLCSMR